MKIEGIATAMISEYPFKTHTFSTKFVFSVMQIQ